MIVWIVVVVAVLLAVFVIAGYNALVMKRNRVKNGWHQIDVQLKRRTDLIPNLVETVKGYAAHEKGVFERVTEARAAVMKARGPAESAQANNMLSDTLKSLFAVVENYPDLKANQNFLKLQEELTATENKISFARQFYNDMVMDFNNRIQMFPSNIIAGLFRFEAAEFYTVPEAEREAPKVSFTG
ncbi:MAG TPA: LemA family protein [candidate division WOR-3 bacterium]|uniref:LemA family protein n=1 Tax=candidate division WOR-3 bacterium TaxID=2052148 RepID=A0A7V0T4Q6_UNCW3|nr:LemA family protein [candidate division WOR-3 bacterium]